MYCETIKTIRILAVIVLLPGLVFIPACCRNGQISDRIPSEVQAAFDKLNSWYRDELNIAECPDNNSGYYASGETYGWILEHKECLRELGFAVKWNCDKKIYELHRLKNGRMKQK